MKRLLALLLTIFCSGSIAKPEVVTFTNGDQLTGDWVRIVENKLVLKTDIADEVSVPVSKLKGFVTDKPAVLLLKDGKALRGSVSLTPSCDWMLETGNQKRVVPAGDVEAIFPQAAYEPASLGGRQLLRRNWTGKGNFGYSLVRGNQDAGTISLGVNATRREPNLPGLNERLRTNYFLTMLVANTRATSGLMVSANSITSGLRQDFLLTPQNFFFLLGQLDHVQSQGLDLRQTYGLGFGHDLVHGPRLEVTLLGGTTLEKENFQKSIRRNGSEGLVGEKLSLKLSKYVSFDEYLHFYPSLTDTGEYRADTASTLSIRVLPRVSLNTNFTRLYLSNPVLGLQKNESVLATGLGFSF